MKPFFRTTLRERNPHGYNTSTKTMSDFSTEKLQEALQTRIGLRLRDYQEEGVRWMLQHESHPRGGCLCDDPGLGKTLQAMTLLLRDELVGPSAPSIIVVPTSLLKQWVDLAHDLLGETGKTRVIRYYGKDKALLTPEALAQCRVVITTYGTVNFEKLNGALDLLEGHASMTPVEKVAAFQALPPEEQRALEMSAAQSNRLFQNTWQRVILDEAHRIKNPKSLAFRRNSLFKTSIRWVLTGTPIQNTPKELKTLFLFTLGKSYMVEHGHDLEALAETHLLRRTKEDKLTLKAIDEAFVHVPMEDPEERRLYTSLMERITRAAQVIDQTQKGGTKAMALFELLLRKRQATQHLDIVYSGLQRKYQNITQSWNKSSSKHKTLFELLPSREGSLVFCHFTQEIHILAKALREMGRPVFTLHGSMSTDEREAAIEATRMCDPTRGPVFLCQIIAGGVGLNLQHIHWVFITSPDWNPCNEIQAIARSHRSGQQESVHVRRLVLTMPSQPDMPDTQENKTIDELIRDRQTDKLEMIGDILQDKGYQHMSSQRKRAMGHQVMMDLLTQSCV